MRKRRTRRERIAALEKEKENLEAEERLEAEQRRTRWSELLGPPFVAAVEAGEESAVALARKLVDALSRPDKRKLRPLLAHTAPEGGGESPGATQSLPAGSAS